jgi:hypothetical protein
MVKTQVFYLNDERKPITVKILDMAGDRFETLQPAEGKTYDIMLPDEPAILYVKKWPAMVMISYIATQHLPVSYVEPLAVDADT